MAVEQDMEFVQIALAANHRYLPGLLATMASMILFASDKDRLQFHVFAEGLEDADCDEVRKLARRLGLVREIDFHYPDMKRIGSLFTAYKGSHAAFLRLFLCEFLACEWVVYADVDTLWMRDVCQLWNERDDSVSVLWCKDLPSIAAGVKEYSLKFNSRFDVSKYACSGVILMNLKRMRESGFTGKCADFARTWGTPLFVDQDILNTVCFDDSKLLDQRWDCMMPNRQAVDGVVVHFNGIGSMFNGPMKGWRVLYYCWYRFYYDVIQEEPTRSVCPFFKRLVFWLIGRNYPNRRFLKCFCWPFGRQFIDNVERALFFAWLWRHARWWWQWNVLREG